MKGALELSVIIKHVLIHKKNKTAHARKPKKKYIKVLINITCRIYPKLDAPLTKSIQFKSSKNLYLKNSPTVDKATFFNTFVIKVLETLIWWRVGWLHWYRQCYAWWRWCWCWPVQQQRGSASEDTKNNHHCLLERALTET